MLSVTINGQKINAGQYVYAKPLFPFGSGLTDTPVVQTVFTNPALRPAKIHHFAVHTFQASDSTVYNGFAVNSWLLSHPLKNSIGKPYEIWCKSLYECSAENFLLPLQDISSLSIPAEYTFEEVSVLVLVPLL